MEEQINQNSQLSVKEAIIQELAKCKSDPIYFCKKYYMIQHPTRGRVRFTLYPFQESVLKLYLKNQFCIINKSRQLGISTLASGYALWLMLFNSDKNVLCVATKTDTAKNMVTKVKFGYDNLPGWMKIKSVENNKLSIRLANGSQMKAVSAAGDSARSEAVSLLLIDEAAFIKGIDEIWTSAQQTLATGGGAIILSTPNGTGNLFHKLWVDAEAGGQFNPIKLHWTVHPDRDETWREEQTRLLGDKEAAQECDCDFISSGHTVVDGPIIQWYEQTYVTDPVEKRGFDSNYWIWEYPNYNKSYAVVADVARGDGADNSAFHVIEIDTMTQVAEYRGKIGTTDYGNMLITVATEYNNALLVIENANIGWAVLQVAIDRNYENLYYSYRQDAYIDEEVHLAKGYDLKSKADKVPGFSTTSKTRPLMISKLETYFREKGPIVKSKRLTDELYVFIWNGSRAEAQRGYNDDLVMSFAIALWVRDTALRLRQQGLDLSRKSLGHFGKSKGVYSSTGNSSNGSWDWNGEKDGLTWLI